MAGEGRALAWHGRVSSLPDPLVSTQPRLATANIETISDIGTISEIETISNIEAISDIGTISEIETITNI